MTSGMVFNIQRYSIHDGPGIRTTAFLKGCPLACAWCHNPESLRPMPEVVFRAERCLKCGWCVKACPRAAISLDSSGWRRDASRCDGCGACATVCPSEAVEVIGRRMTVAEVLAEVEKDRIFYSESGGGITVSGGEPLAQPDFLAGLLSACRQKGLHTVVDTSGCAPWATFERILPDTCLFLYDLKHLDDDVHQRWTGVSNVQILDNLAHLAETGAAIEVRMPVVPGMNDSDEHLDRLGRRVAGLGLKRLHLLPYHRTAIGKYERFGYQYRLPETAEPTAERLAEIVARLEKLGLTVTIG